MRINVCYPDLKPGTEGSNSREEPLGFGGKVYFSAPLQDRVGDEWFGSEAVYG